MKLEFDRGTILLRDPPAGLQVEELPDVRWDPRVGLHRTPARNLSPLRAELVRRGVRFSDIVRPAGQEPAAWTPIDLRPYQDAALEAWAIAGRRGLVVLPTGSGKTRLALAAMARTRLRSLCLVPTRALLDQWTAEIKRVYGGDVGCYGDGERELRAITVATFESAFRHMERIGDRFELLVVDEAHHFGCGVRDEALEMSIAGARLGLSATPPRQEPAASRLSTLVGPTVYELAIGDLAGTYLADFDLVMLHLDLSPAERIAYERDLTAFRSFHSRFCSLCPNPKWEDFARSAARSVEGRSALTGLRRAKQALLYPAAKRDALARLLALHRKARVLVFTADNRSAYSIAREHLIMPLTCDIGRKERDEALARFRAGELRALVSARVLNEGLDVPDADVAIVVGGTLGEREHVQRVGRLLRPRVGKRALVYELVVRRSLEIGQARRRGDGLAARSPAQL